LILTIACILAAGSPAKAEHHWTLGLIPGSYHWDRSTEYNENQGSACIGYNGYSGCVMDNSVSNTSLYFFYKNEFATSDVGSLFTILGFASGYEGEDYEIAGGIIPVVSVGIQFGPQNANLRPLVGVSPIGYFFWGAELRF